MFDSQEYALTAARIDAANDYRAIDALMDEMNKRDTRWDSLDMYQYTRRFYSLHKSFYARVVDILSAIDECEDPDTYRKQIREEQKWLARMCYHLKRNTLESFVQTVVHAYDWDVFFWKCVDDIMEDWMIDTETNEIVFSPIEEDEESE